MKRTAAIVGISLAVMFGGVAMTSRLAPTPPTIAVIDVETLINKLDEKAAFDNEMKKRGEAIKKKVDSLDDQIKKAQAELETTPRDQRRAVIEKLARLRVEAEIEVQFGQRGVSEQVGAFYRDVYNKIEAAAEAVAKRGGYTIVFSSDKSVDLPGGANANDVMRTISLKRFLYVDNQHDITQEVVTLMNNQYKAGK